MLRFNEPPMINSNHKNIYSVLKHTIKNKKKLIKIGDDCYNYYLKYHHIKNIAKEFKNIMKGLNYEFKK